MFVNLFHVLDLWDKVGLTRIFTPHFLQHLVAAAVYGHPSLPFPQHPDGAGRGGVTRALPVQLSRENTGFSALFSYSWYDVLTLARLIPFLSTVPCFLRQWVACLHPH